VALGEPRDLSEKRGSDDGLVDLGTGPGSMSEKEPPIEL
jgi:hypothetical protein